MFRILRRFGFSLAGVTLGGLLQSSLSVAAAEEEKNTSKHHILIIGGGTAGITVAAQLAKKIGGDSIAIVEPKDVHYYQPLWTLVGGGIYPKEKSVQPEEKYIPKGATWFKDSVTEVNADKNEVKLATGKTVKYDYLVVAAGLQLNWSKIKGLPETLGKNGVVSIYSYETVGDVFKEIDNFKGGAALFTQPSTPIKCAGAPQKIMWLAEDHWSRTGRRQEADITFVLPQPAMFGVKKYSNVLDEMRERRGVKAMFKHEVVEVRGEKKEVVIRNADGTEEVKHFDFLHIVPPMSAPTFLMKSSLANPNSGFVDVDKATTQHTKYANVFALGDCSSLPTSKTAAAISAEAPVLVHNLLQVRDGRKPNAEYDGYTSCPILTRYGKLILAEFKYGGEVQETFPFDQGKERYSMYLLKTKFFPYTYWNYYITGKWYGPRTWFAPKFEK